MAQDDDRSQVLAEQLEQQARIEELPSDDDDSSYESVEDEDELTSTTETSLRKRRRRHRPEVPPWLCPAALRIFPEKLATVTSDAQSKTTDECLPYLLGEDAHSMPLNSYGLPHLRRTQHSAFLHSQLEALPAPYIAIDASRPWFFYWVLCGLSTLGEDVSHYNQSLTETIRPLQNSTGGFGGGYGQLSHCACTYATVLALATTGGLDVIDRKAMWHWLGTIKQADGGFCMAVGAEEDIRGAYCAMTILTLLNLPLELPPDAIARKAGMTSFLDRLGEWIGRCQTYEGGIGGAPTNEAHGAYAFCALACLSIIDIPSASIPKYLNLPSLIDWLVARQTQPEGGFQGRQEKLVDACYSHWVGGCWALIQAALPTIQLKSDIWNREALVRYLLTCCQRPGKFGGMRDKPSTRPDAYHTCYSLAGLSHAQNRYTYSHDAAVKDTDRRKTTAPFHWSAQTASDEEAGESKIDTGDHVEFVHPVFVIPMAAVEKAKIKFHDANLSI